jgi:DNA-binding transcriptional ArsR family regulator
MPLRKPSPPKIPSRTELLALDKLWLEQELDDVRTHTEDLLRLYRLLGNRARLNIALALWKDPATPSQLSFYADITPSTVTYHAALMERAGLLQSTRSGRIKQVELTPLARDILLPAMDTLKGA